MSLQDDIARYAGTWNYGIGIDPELTESIAAGLERGYYLVKLDSLQPVGILDGHYAIAGVRVASTDRDLGLLKVDRDYAIAVYEYAKARESEAAVLARRRDELAARLEVSANGGYDRLCDGERGVIDDLIAAEAELARLKETL